MPWSSPTASWSGKFGIQQPPPTRRTAVSNEMRSFSAAAALPSSECSASADSDSAATIGVSVCGCHTMLWQTQHGHRARTRVTLGSAERERERERERWAGRSNLLMVSRPSSCSASSMVRDGSSMRQRLAFSAALAPGKRHASVGLYHRRSAMSQSIVMRHTHPRTDSRTHLRGGT